MPGDITLTSGRDAVVTGADVEGEETTVKAGRNLTVASQQDTASSSSRQDSGGVGISVDVISGAVSGSADIARQRGQAERAWVDNQTSIRGRKSVNIDVGGHTQIDGAVVTAPGGQVSINTGTFGHSDIADREKSKDTGVSIGLSRVLKKGKGPSPDAGTTHGGIEGGFAETDKEGVSRATVGDGTITVRDEAGQKALEDSGATQQVAAINRDENLAQEVTKDETTAFEFYASDTSIKNAAEAVETAGKTIGEVFDAIADAAAEAGAISEEEKVSAKERRGPTYEVEITAICQVGVDCDEAQAVELAHRLAEAELALADYEAGKISQLPAWVRITAETIDKLKEENPQLVALAKSIVASSGFITGVASRITLEKLYGKEAVAEFDRIVAEGGDHVREKLLQAANTYADKLNLNQSDRNHLKTLVNTTSAIAAITTGAIRGRSFSQVNFNVNRLPGERQIAVNDTLSHINSGTIPSGPTSIRWGINFRNRDGNLPTRTTDGIAITYKEYRVAPRPGQPNAGTDRIVVGSDGRQYYTGTHYGDNPGKPFVRIK